jgi:phosphatidylserine/phosphatidylglycerophosphate/cardiolipin synthase-like enzyme
LDVVLKKARSRIVIHSTFIDVTAFRALSPQMHEAARRGVKIDILWGKSDRSDGTNEMSSVMEECLASLQSDEVRERITFHTATTNSHSKIIIADNGKGRLIAYVGSCNWLSSKFRAFDVSVRLADPDIVGDLLGVLAQMAAPKGNLWPPLTRDLTLLSRTAKQHAPSSHGIKATGHLVFGSQHANFIRIARDQARTRILVLSHRFSPNAEALVLAPTSAAVKANAIDVKLMYGQLDGPNEGAIAAALASSARENGIRTEMVFEPTLHAKVLIWDSDHVVITSQNWLSADPGEAEQFSEIGIHLSARGLADELISKISFGLTPTPY